MEIIWYGSPVGLYFWPILHKCFLMVSGLIPSMNLSIEASLYLIYTVIVTAYTSGVESGRYYSLGIKHLCGNWRSITIHGVYIRRSLPRSIDFTLAAG